MASTNYSHSGLGKYYKITQKQAQTKLASFHFVGSLPILFFRQIEKKKCHQIISKAKYYLDLSCISLQDLPT